ncbi:hypothetical protein LSH36_65g06006 [Paralvinella palmiformis]|uniref:RNA helicase n=1 Tax=Paralvinella palmiformis TaxID=53620 RepID=A0AAD9K3Z0_9ANNE|nr:hypothetical protein LSH36_65g06006 [Paralvinella palmiformis]
MVFTRRYSSMCTDDIIGMYDHDINDATCVIHYDVPQKKWVLGKRLWCMRRNWKSPLEKEQIGVDDAKQCLSYFYMTESNDDVASPIIKLLERSQSDIPQVLCQMAVKYEEEIADVPISPNSSGRMCQLRHRIVQSLDYPGQNPCYIKVPTEGQVKTKQQKVPQVNKLYAFEDTQHVFNRILILEMTRSGHSKIKINVKMASDIGNQELFGNIVLSFGCTLWLDPLVSRTKLKHLDLVVEEYSARGLLLESDQAEPNPEVSVKNLFMFCISSVMFIHHLYSINNLLVKTRSQELPTSADQDYVEVLVQAVDTPDLFYVQLKEDKQRIEQLEVDITDFVKHNQLQCPNKIRPSTLVLARFPGSNMWNRGKVSAVLSDEEYDVFFVDYGDTEVIKRADVLPMPTCFQTIPFYSIECCLVGVEAIGDGWSDDAGNLLYDITRQCVNGAEAKVLMAKVMSRASAHYSGKFVYGLELLDTTQSYCSNISHELVRHKSAKFSLLQIEELFPQLLLLPPESAETKVIQCCIDIIKSQTCLEPNMSFMRIERFMF